MIDLFNVIIENATDDDIRIVFGYQSDRRICFSITELSNDETQVYFIYKKGAFYGYYDIEESQHMKKYIKLLANIWYHLSDNEMEKAKAILKLHNKKMDDVFRKKYFLQIETEDLK